MKKGSELICSLVIEKGSRPMLEGKLGEDNHLFFLAKHEKCFIGLIVTQKNQSLLEAGGSWNVLGVKIIRGHRDRLQLFDVSSSAVNGEDWYATGDGSNNIAIFLFRFNNRYYEGSLTNPDGFEEVIVPYPSPMAENANSVSL